MTFFYQVSSADHQPAVSDVLQELQEVRDEASATKEQLDSYKESCSRLQEELQVCGCLCVTYFLSFFEAGVTHF